MVPTGQSPHGEAFRGGAMQPDMSWTDHSSMLSSCCVSRTGKLSLSLSYFPSHAGGELGLEYSSAWPLMQSCLVASSWKQGTAVVLWLSVFGKAFTPSCCGKHKAQGGEVCGGQSGEVGMQWLWDQQQSQDLQMEKRGVNIQSMGEK